MGVGVSLLPYSSLETHASPASAPGIPAPGTGKLTITEPSSHPSHVAQLGMWG